MRTTILTLIFSLLTSLLFSQPENKVEQIRMTVEQIDNDTAYNIKTLENEQFIEHLTEGKGRLTGYFKNGNLVKIVEFINLSGCIKDYEYYYVGDVLIFVHGKEKVFKYIDSTSSFDNKQQEPGWGCAYYFLNNNLIKSIAGGHNRCFYSLKESQTSNILKFSKRYLELLKEIN